MSTAFIYHPDCEAHDTGPEHPENWTRIRHIVESVRSGSFAAKLDWLDPKPATSAEIEAAHSPEYHRFIEEAALSGTTVVDSGDTRISEESYQAARLAAGAGILGVDRVLAGANTSAFACIRPPGHHASRSKAMGFCLFNNIAVAARHAQRAHGVGRVMIIDWDVHHGNGTQDIFYEDDSVFFFSIHQSLLYPGTGSTHERGSGKGEGYTINVPVDPRSTVDEYLRVWQGPLRQAAERIRPELILVSCGFDAHRQDPLGDVCLESADFGRLALETRHLAEAHCKGRLVMLLEGGYCVPVLGDCVNSVLGAL